MQVKAKAMGVKTTPRKIGLVAALVRGRSVGDAITILEHTPKRAAKILAGVIESARANAENNHKLNKEGLTINSILVGPGQTMKRFRPAAFGAAHPIRYRTSNVTVLLDGSMQTAPKAKPKQVKAKSK